VKLHPKEIAMGTPEVGMSEQTSSPKSVVAPPSTRPAPPQPQTQTTTKVQVVPLPPRQVQQPGPAAAPSTLTP
jgi:hypothetical protein